MAADSPRVRPEREMRRVRKLTCAAYANQRMTLTGKLRQSIKKKRNTMIALRVQSRGVFSSFMFLQGRLAMPSSRRGDREHATLLFRARECRFDSAEKGRED